MTPLSVNVITDLSFSKNKNLIIEIRSNERITLLSQYGFSDFQIQKITENLSLNIEKRTKKIVFSHVSSEFDVITCFFPSDSLMDDRSELFSGLTTHSIFLPE